LDLIGTTRPAIDASAQRRSSKLGEESTRDSLVADLD
jgi:hypothetical protein